MPGEPAEAPVVNTPVPAGEGGDSAPLAVDTALEEGDDSSSDYGSSLESESTTMSSSVTDYKYENGRRYHSYREGEYWAPNDETQNEQLDLFHHLYNISLGGELYRAPIGKNIHRILDLGTGTGIWAIDMADRFPSAVITGTDLSPIQPSWVPPNCQFEVDDFNLEWTYKEDYFDYIHARALYASVSDWRKLLGEGLRALVPGGWFESLETTTDWFSDDGTIPAGSATSRWCALLNEASAATGKPFAVAGKVAGWMEDAGFENVVAEVYKIPVGPWPRDRRFKDIGRLNREVMLQGIEGFTVALFTRVLKWNLADTKALLEEVRSEILDRNIHGYYTMHVSIGQKPKK